MPAEGEIREVRAPGNAAQDKHSFDELARGLANGTMSRRQALRWMGGAIAGAVLASIPGMALAQGDSDCAHCCKTTFPPGPERGRCISACARGRGPCFESCTTEYEECQQDPELCCVCRKENESNNLVCASRTILNCSRGCNNNSDCPTGTFCFGPFPIQPGFPGTCVARCGTDVQVACP